MKEDLLEVDADVLVSTVIEQTTVLAELVGTGIEVFEDLGLFEVPLFKQTLHRHVHFVLQ